MTRTEAADLLGTLIGMVEDNQDSDYDTALKMAVEALKRTDKRTETHECDYISRQAAIDALNEYFTRIGKLKRRGLTKGEKAISLDTVGAIKTLPSAQPSEDTQAAFEQGRIQGHVEMRTELLKQLKEIVGDEVWKNI